MTSLTRLLTPDRTRGYGSMLIIVNAVMFALTFATPVDKPTIFGDRFAGDFSCFYVAGGMLNDGVPLYDLDTQFRRFHELQPNAPPDLALPYVYAPFFALTFVPLALLPLKLAFAVWTLISLALYIAGFHFAWEASRLPREYKRTGLIAALAFIPFAVNMLGLGQVASFGVFALGLCIWLESKEKSFLSGLVLSFLLFKPTLLILVIPMLVITRRFRVATGLAVGGVALGLLSLLVVGFNGIMAYLTALQSFGQAMTTISAPRGITLSALIGAVTGQRVPFLQYSITLVIFLALIVAWIRRSRLSWALAITFTPFLSPYAQIYDASYLVLSVVLAVGCLGLSRLKMPLLILFLSPIPAVFIVGAVALPLIQLAILGFGLYQLHYTIENESIRHVEPPRSR